MKNRTAKSWIAVLGVTVLLLTACTVEGEADVAESESGGSTTLLSDAPTTSLLADDAVVQEESVATTVADGGPLVLTIPPPGGTIPGETPCPAFDGSSQRVTAFSQAPPMCIDPTVSIEAVVETNRGSFTIALDPAAAPATVNNFVVLALYHYYDGVAFHRIIPGFVVQGGDPVGNPIGTGGPGYSIADELPAEGAYQIGSVAMANAGPNTNGSQFFLVTGENGAALPPSWPLFGQISSGLDVVLDIESTGTDSGQPVEETVIQSITIMSG